MMKRKFMVMASIIACLLACRVGLPSVHGQPEPVGRDAGVVTTLDEGWDVDVELTRGEAFLRRLAEGGVTMLFLLVASVLAVASALERFVNLRIGAIVPAGLAERADALWREQQWEQLKDLPGRAGRSTLARTVAVAARHRHGRLADVSSIVSDVASRDFRRHLERAYPLAIVATIAPLLGLMGTVVGMIGAFDNVAAAGALGDAALLGGDIAKALITTAAGLAIAIPSLAFYHYFKSRTQLLALALEEEMDALLSRWYDTEVATADAPAGGGADAG